MRSASLLLVAASVYACAACEIFDNDLEIAVRGQVTAADDGSPVPGAVVRVSSWDGPTVADTTDNSGRYSLLYHHTGYCAEMGFDIEAQAAGFVPRRIFPPFRCSDSADEVHDVELEREP